jgi:hypothetical protein
MVKWCVENKIYRLMLYPVHGNPDLCLEEKEIDSILMQLHRIFYSSYHHKIPENNFEFLYQSLGESLKNKLDVKENMYNKDLPCMINKIHLAINTNGDILPCETIIDDTDIQNPRNIWIEYKNNIKLRKQYDSYNSLGNVYESDINSIWKANYNNSFRCDKCDRCFSRYQPIIKTYWDNIGKKVFI